MYFSTSLCLQVQLQVTETEKGVPWPLWDSGQVNPSCHVKGDKHTRVLLTQKLGGSSTPKVLPKHNFAKQAQHKSLSPSAKEIQRGIKWQRRLPVRRAVSKCWLEKLLRNTKVSFPHCISSSLNIQGKLYFYECLPWKNNLFFSSGLSVKTEEGSFLAPFPVTWRDGESSSRLPRRYFQEMFVTAQLMIHGWHTALWGSQPREASAWGPYLDYVLEKALLELRCLFRSNKLSGAYLEVLLGKDFCLTALILLKSISITQEE